MKKSFVFGTLLASLSLGGCQMLGLDGAGVGGGATPDCAVHQCRPIVIVVNGCTLSGPKAEYHVSIGGTGPNAEVRFVLGAGARAFAPQGIVIKSDPDSQVGPNGLTSSNPAMWTMVDLATKVGATITYGVHVINNNGDECVLDPVVINDM